jgi:hypothetical protein
MVDDMIKEWYCMVGDRVEGPYSLQELRRLTDAGTLGPDDMVRRGESTPWVAARSVVEPFDGKTAPTPTPPPLPSPSVADVRRAGEPKVALDAPFSEWGISALVMGGAMLLATPLSVHTVDLIRRPGGSTFITFLLCFALEALLVLGCGASVAFGVMGLLGYFKRGERLPLNLAGLVISALSLLLWLMTAVVLIRSMDRP